MSFSKLSLTGSESRVGPKDYLLTQLLLPLDFRQQQFFPVLGTVDVAGPELGSQTVTLAIEQQQRVVAGRFEVAVVGAVLLPESRSNPCPEPPVAPRPVLQPCR